MEAEVRMRDSLHGGASDITTSFWKGEYSNDSVKQGERERVLDFIVAAYAKFPQGAKHGRLLSFPGVRWIFEYMVLQRMTCQFVGLERSTTLYARSRVAMPGCHQSHLSAFRRLSEDTMRYGRASIVYSDVKSGAAMHAFTGRENRLLLMDAETYATVLFTDYGATRSEKDLFNAMFHRRNAVWLDHTSQLCASVENTLRHLPFCLHPEPFRKPVVVTVMNARDHYRGDQERVERMLQVQPALEYADHWTYVGKGNVSMLTVCFFVR